MKNFRLITVILLTALSFSITSCDKDDDNNNDNASSANSFTYNGTTYDLSQGLLEDYGDNGNGSYDFDITFLGTGISYDVNSEEVSGTGSAIYLDLNSNDMNDLSDGTYVFSIDRDAFTLVVAGALIDYNFDTDNGTVIEADAGNVMLSKSGNEYDIEFNFSNTNGDVVSGNYRGTLLRI